MTSIGEGAAWGWRTLSPGAPFTEGRPYGAEENQKVLVLMTDGQNTYYAQQQVPEVPVRHFTATWRAVSWARPRPTHQP